MSEQEYAYAPDERPRGRQPATSENDRPDINPLLAGVTPEFPAAGSNGSLKLRISLPAVLSGGDGDTTTSDAKVVVWMTSLTSSDGDMSARHHPFLASLKTGETSTVTIPTVEAHYNEALNFYGVVLQAENPTTGALESVAAEVFNRVAGGDGTVAGEPLAMNVNGAFDSAGIDALIGLTFARGPLPAPAGAKHFAKIWVVPIATGVTTVDYDPANPTNHSTAGPLPAGLATTQTATQVNQARVGFVMQLWEKVGATRSHLFTSCEIFDVNTSGDWTFVSKGTANPIT